MIASVLKGEKDLLPSIAASLRERLDAKDEGAISTMAQAAGALEPIIASAVERNPSRLGKLGLKSAHLLASLTVEDRNSSSKLAEIAHNETVGIVFVDVAGFTTFTAERGDDDAIALIRRLAEINKKVAQDANGEVVKHLGDGFLLAFPSASQATRAATMLRGRVAKLRKDDPTFPVHLRIAVHAGEPLVEGDDLLGHDVNLTARLLDHCSPDEIVISEAAKELAEKRLKKIRFGARRKVKIRGLASRITVFGVDPEERNVLTKLKPERPAGRQRSSSS